MKGRNKLMDMNMRNNNTITRRHKSLLTYPEIRAFVLAAIYQEQRLPQEQLWEGEPTTEDAVTARSTRARFIRKYFGIYSESVEVAERLVSVRTLHAGLQSFLSMRRIEARCKNASALRLRFSQSFASLRHRLSHAMERSTIHLFGRTTNLCSSLRLTISMIQSPLRAAAKAARSPR